jgi:hypothetical protein
MWWTFMLGYYSDKDDPKDEDFVPVFGEGSFDDRLESYDNFYDEEDEFWLPVTKKLAFLTSFWHNGSIKTQEAFGEAEKLYDDSLKAETENSEAVAEKSPKEEVAKEDDAPKKEE